MYKNYILALKSDLSVEEKINKAWEKISKQAPVLYNKNCKDKKLRKGEWKTVRIFVSSTFTDFHNEREVLVKKVFPLLREWCETRRLHVVECDLRWGVPKDSPTSQSKELDGYISYTNIGTTITTCMDELERCFVETNGEPFFINLLGERYGWIPEDNDVADNIKHNFGWIPNISITHMEIQYGAYRNENQNASFYFRDPHFLKDVPSDVISRFQDQDLYARGHLTVLKEKLKSRFGSHVYNYSCRVAGKDSSLGRQQLKLEGLEEFAEKVLAFFKQAIDRKYQQAECKETSTDSLEENIHNNIMESKSSLFFGRDREVEVLKRYSKGHIDEILQQRIEDAVEVTETYKKDLQKFELTEEDCPILAVTAEPGMGKSALLAKVASDLIQEEYDVMYHCVGISASSFHGRNVLLRIISKLATKLSNEVIAQIKGASMDDLVNKMKTCLVEYRNQHKHITIIIDGVNELRDTVNILSWLPPKLPSNIRCIISCNNECTKTIRNIKMKRPYYLCLGSFGEESRKQLVDNFFGAYNKKLDHQQSDMLTSHLGAGTPLWLSMACEELRIYGDFKMLTKKIQDLPFTLDGLFQKIIQRLIIEDETCCLEKVLCMIKCAQSGLPESQVLDLLGNFSKREPVPLITWATVRRYIKPFIRTVTTWQSGEPRIQFFHSSLTQAVEKELFKNSTNFEQWHEHFVKFYRDVCKDEYNTSVELPYHLKMLKNNNGLLTFLRTDYRAVHLPHYVRVEYAQGLRCQQYVPSASISNNDFVMCTWCGMKTDLSRSGGQNKDKCIICGQWTPHTLLKVVPKLCRQHQQIAPKNMERCGLCTQMIHQHNGPAIKARFCTLCASWKMSSVLCCYLLH